MMNLPFSSHRSRKLVAVKSQIILRADGVYQSQKVHLVPMQFYADNPNSFNKLSRLRGKATALLLAMMLSVCFESL